MLEVVRGDATSDVAITTAMKIGRSIGKTPVLCGVCHGFGGQQKLSMRGIEAEKMILEGAAPSKADQVLFDFGLPMGPFAMSDLAGLDIGWDETTSSGATVRELLCESGRRGQKTAEAITRMTPIRAATPDPEVEEIIAAFAERQGIERAKSATRKFSNAAYTRWSMRAPKFFLKKSLFGEAMSMLSGSTDTGGPCTPAAQCFGQIRSGWKK